MTAAPLRVEQWGAIRWLFLDRPASRNALDEHLVAALRAAVAGADADEATSVIVIAGEGPSFCAGGDFRQFLAAEGTEGVVEFLGRVSDCMTAIERSPKPWIAALHGHAIAGGLEIALACDVVIAAEDTLIGDGHLRNRLLPAAGSSVRLERAIGKGAARWLHLSGESLRATDRAFAGWLREVVPAAAVRAHAQQLAERLAARDSGAQQNMKRLLISLDGADPHAGLAVELEAFGRNWDSSDVRGALVEFLEERRSPSRKEQK